LKYFHYFILKTQPVMNQHNINDASAFRTTESTNNCPVHADIQPTQMKEFKRLNTDYYAEMK